MQILLDLSGKGEDSVAERVKFALNSSDCLPEDMKCLSVKVLSGNVEQDLETIARWIADDKYNLVAHIFDHRHSITFDDEVEQ